MPYDPAYILAHSLKTLDSCLQKNLMRLGPSKQGDSHGKTGRQTRLAGIRTDQVEVYARVTFLKLGEVDTVHEKFCADVITQARWREPALDSLTAEDGELPNWADFWDPKLHIENGLGDLKEHTWHTVMYSEEGEATVYQKRRVKGTFFEKMELMEYPFDTQDLTVTLTSERGEHELRLLPDQVEVSSVNVQSFVDEQEWKLHKHVNSWTKVNLNAYMNTKNKNPAISISCKVCRRSQFFLWNIILIMIFISSLVFTTFTVGQDKVQNRLQLSFILLLSNITFKFTVSQTLPKVSYLTILDKYIIGSMVQLCVVCLWHAIVSQFIDDMELAQRADMWALGILGGCYVIFNLAFYIMGQCITRSRLKDYARRDRIQQEKVKAMEERVVYRQNTSFVRTSSM